MTESTADAAFTGSVSQPTSFVVRVGPQVFLGVAGLSALAVLLGISPWSLWPFVVALSLALCAALLVQNCSTSGATMLGVLIGLIWVIGEWWRNGPPTFMGWFVPIASFTILTLVFHHILDLQAPIGRVGARPDQLPCEQSDLTPLRITAAADTVQCFLRAFNQWHRDWADQDEPWPAFDCFLRDQLLERLGAKQVECFRVVADRQFLMPLGGGNDWPRSAHHTSPARSAATRATDSAPPASTASEPSRLRPRWKPLPVGQESGIEGHVAATGRVFFQGQSGGQPAPFSGRGRSSDHRPAIWCFPVRRAEETIGVVRVGALSRYALAQRPLLDLVADLVALCWARVYDVHELGIARRMDMVSGVLSRSDFLTVAVHTLADSFEAREPVVLVVLALEGMRSLDDRAKWRSRDQLARRVGQALNRRLRSDDVIGRFSDDRFVVLLRRTDRELGQRLAGELHDRVVEALAEPTADEGDAAMQVASPVLGVRCVAAAAPGPYPQSENASARLHDLVTRAFTRLEVARHKGEKIAFAGEDSPEEQGIRSCSAEPTEVPDEELCVNADA